MKKNEEKLEIREIESLEIDELKEVVGGPVDGESIAGSGGGGTGQGGG